MAKTVRAKPWEPLGAIFVCSEERPGANIFDAAPGSLVLKETGLGETGWEMVPPLHLRAGPPFVETTPEKILWAILDYAKANNRVFTETHSRMSTWTDCHEPRFGRVLHAPGDDRLGDRVPNAKPLPGLPPGTFLFFTQSDPGWLLIHRDTYAAMLHDSNFFVVSAVV